MQRHRAGLVGADAVLAGDRAAGVDAGLEDLLGEQLRALRLARDARVVEHERMEVAVAGVEDVADAQAGSLRELVDAAQHLRQLRARDDAVLHVVVGADPAHRGERRLAPAPDRGALGRRPRRRGSRGAGSAQICLDRARSSSTCAVRPVELDDQHRAAAGADSPAPTAASAASIVIASIISIAAGSDAGGDDPRHRRARLVGVVEAGEQRPHRLGRAQDAQRQRRRDPERALGADEHAEQVGAVVPDRERRPARRPAARSSAASTWLTVKPYLRQCAPPEFSATLPPIVQTCCDDGSGA